MRFSSRAARRRRGAPLWAYLTALVLVPLLGVVALTGAIVRIAVDEAGSAARSEAAIGALARLHAARSAVIREIVPTLTLVIIESPDSATILGTGSEVVSGLRGGAQALLRETRAATDQAFDDIKPGSTMLTALQAAADPALPYACITGDTTLIDGYTELRVRTVLAALGRRVANLAFLIQPNDLAVAVVSGENLPRGRAPRPPLGAASLP